MPGVIISGHQHLDTARCKGKEQENCQCIMFVFVLGKQFMKNHFLHYQIMLKYYFSPAQPARMHIAKPTQASQIIALCL